MLVNKKLQRLGLLVRKLRTAAPFLRNPPPDLAMIFFESLSQIVQQQREVQRRLILQAPINVSQAILALRKSGRFLDRPNAMLVDRVLVILIELQQAPRVTKTPE